MKIAFFMPYPDNGGAMRSVGNLAAQFVQEGHSSTLLAIRRGGRMQERLGERGVSVQMLGGTRAALAVPSLARYLRRQRPDALISVQHYANVLSIAARGIARTDTALILTERLALAEALEADPPHKRIALKLLMRRLYGRANAVVARSEGEAEELRRFLPPRHAGKVHAIYNPFPLSTIRAAAEQDAPLHPWLAHGRPFTTLVSMGRLHPQKDFPTLLEAFAQAHGRNANLRLLIYGSGSQRDALLAQRRRLGLEQAAELLEFQDNPFPHMRAADLYVCSSRYEGLPNSLIEAQICGVGVVTTNCSAGAREAVLGGRAGGLVPVGNASALADEITRITATPDAARNMLKTASDNLQRFSSEEASRRYIQLIGKRRPNN